MDIALPSGFRHGTGDGCRISDMCFALWRCVVVTVQALLLGRQCYCHGVASLLQINQGLVSVIPSCESLFLVFRSSHQIGNAANVRRRGLWLVAWEGNDDAGGHGQCGFLCPVRPGLLSSCPYKISHCGLGEEVNVHASDIVIPTRFSFPVGFCCFFLPLLALSE